MSDVINLRIWDANEQEMCYNVLSTLQGHDFWNEFLGADEVVSALEDGTCEELGLVPERYVSKGIYENDILVSKAMIPGDEKYVNAVPIGVVTYEDYQWWVVSNNSAIPLFSESIEFEKIGNIHENDFDKLSKNKKYSKPTM